jgi:outer membrane protein assembly factor BamB
VLSNQRVSRNWFFCKVATVAVATFSNLAAVTAATNDWPVYRHDVALTGTASGKGNIVHPTVKRKHYLGAPFVERAAVVNAPDPSIADLDGDGVTERFTLGDRTIRVTSLEGKELWSFTVDGLPLGGNVRVGRFLPERKGLQIISFSGRMDSGKGQGYCFSFEEGASHGKLAWTTGPLENQYAPTLVVDDADGDGLLDIVTAPHYQVQIYSGQTGQLKATVTEAKGRNYGTLLTRARRGHKEKDIFVISDFVLHVECVRFEDGKWTHAWGQKYLDDENAPRPEGRQWYLRVCPNPVADFAHDGTNEMVYMLVDGTKDDQWHLIVRECEAGKVTLDLPGIWLWGARDLDGDGLCEIFYTPTKEKRPPGWCDVHVAHFAQGRLTDLDVLKKVRPVLMTATFPANEHTIADEAEVDILQLPVEAGGKEKLFLGKRSAAGTFDDGFFSAGISHAGKFERAWQFRVPGHRLNLVSAGPEQFGVRDLTAGEILKVNGRGEVISRSPLGEPGGFSTLPIVADLDGDGTNEIVLQNAAREIVALRVPRPPATKLQTLWSQPGVAMTASSGYTWNGALCPQIADVVGDGRPHILFAAEDENGSSSLVCVDGKGKVVWRRSIPGCPWGGLQAGIDHWTAGRFTGRKGMDVYVDLHRRSKGSGEGWLLRGDTGEVVWQRRGIAAKETAMPYGGGIPAVADADKDGADDLWQMFYTVYSVCSGKTGEPLLPPAFLTGSDYFGKWIAYSEPTVDFLDGTGKPQVYLNSRSYARGAYAAIQSSGKPLWVEFHNNDEGSPGLGPVGDFLGTGKRQIGVPVLNGTVLCLDAATGAHLWTNHVQPTGDMIAADVNGDGIKDIVLSAADGKLHALNAKDGAELWSIAAGGDPIAADIDGDGLLDILAAGSDGILRIIGEAPK